MGRGEKKHFVLRHGSIDKQTGINKVKKAIYIVMGLRQH
jgi:hypothetical protein